MFLKHSFTILIEIWFQKVLLYKEYVIESM